MLQITITLDTTRANDSGVDNETLMKRYEYSIEQSGKVFILYDPDDEDGYMELPMLSNAINLYEPETNEE